MHDALFRLVNFYTTYFAYICLDIPDEYKTYEMCQKVFACYTFMICHIPERFLNYDMWVT